MDEEKVVCRVVKCTKCGKGPLKEFFEIGDKVLCIDCYIDQ